MRLQKTMTENNFQNVIVRELALGAKTGQARLLRNVAAPATARLALENESNIDTLNVKVSTVDEEISRVSAAKFGLLKIDVEGFELDVLNGAKRSLASDLWQAILIEVCPGNLATVGKSLTDLSDFCASMGYALFSLDVRGEKGRRMSVAELSRATLINVLLARTSD
jgi:FkbM family methyltransferase